MILLISGAVRAQIQWSDFNNYRQYSAKDGLEFYQIENINEDPYGFIWIGTDNGVIRFDGSQFVKYELFDSSGHDKPIGQVDDIIFDTTGTYIFLATKNGILSSLLKEIQFKPLIKDFPKVDFTLEAILKLHIDNKNILWVGSIGKGLFLIDLQSGAISQHLFKTENKNSSLSQLNSINEIEGSNSDLDTYWIGTNQGLVEFKRSAGNYDVHYFQDDPTLLQNRITSMAQSQEEIYIGTFKRGWYIFNKKSKRGHQPIKEGSQFFAESCRNMYLDKESNLWVSTVKGLVQYDTRTKTIVNARLDKINFGVSLVDSRGIIWFFTSNLYRFDPDHYKRFIRFVKKEKEYPVIVLNIVRINNDYYVCPFYGEGIHKISPAERTIKTIQIPQLPYRDLGAGYLFRDMQPLANDNLVILGDNRMVFLDTSTDQSYEPPVQIPDSVMVLRGTTIRDKNNDQWVATYTSGLYKLNYDNLSIENYQKEFKGLNTHEHKHLKKLFVDSKNRLWIGQSSTSVMDLETNEIICFNPEFDYDNREIFGGFYEDKMNRIWVANLVDGLSFVDGNNLDSGLNKILEGSFYGVYRYTDNQLWTLGKAGLGILDIHSFTHKLVNVDVETEFVGPIVDMGNGDYMIGCLDGVMIYNPEKHSDYADIPKIFLKEIRANNQILSGEWDFNNTDFSLPSGTKALNVKIGSLAFKDTEKLTFQYRMDDVWIDLGSSKEINLSNLYQGDYNIDIRPINAFGQSLASKRYKFTVNPFWYTTKLALVVYVLLAMAIIYALYKFNLNRRLALAESRQLKELNEVKSKMYANISHEFRTPLTLIKGLSNMVMKNTDDINDKNLLDGIDQSSDQLMNLVDQMLDLAALDAKKMVVKYKNGDVIKFIEQIVNLFRSFSDSRSQKLMFYSDTDELIMDFDDEKMQKILNNLLSNAIKFTPERGMIEVRLENLKSHLQIVVKDTGRGINKQDLQFLFDRHFTRKDTKGSIGSGIGLALTKELVELLDGTISVRSKSGVGTQFTITFPVKSESLDTQIEHHLPFVQKNSIFSDSLVHHEMNVRGKTVLVVEDNRDIRLFVKKLLSPTYQILLARNGEEGIKIASSQDIHFIICDVMMPVMGGFEFCRKIKSDVTTSHIPFIMLTARTQAKDKRKAYELGVDSYLTKPFDPNELKLVINNLLAKQKDQKEFLMQLLSIKQPEKYGPDINKLDLGLIIKLQKLILENTSKVSVGEIAKQLFVSRSQLHRKVKALTGMPITHYSNHIRIEKAKNLLHDTNLSISAIAYDVGYDDPSYFSKIFRKFTSASPMEFRKKSLEST